MATPAGDVGCPLEDAHGKRPTQALEADLGSLDSGLEGDMQPLGSLVSLVPQADCLVEKGGRGGSQQESPKA